MITEQIALYLTAQGVCDYRADRLGGDTFLHHMPAEPSTAMAVMPSAHPPPDEQTYGYDWVRVQLIVRGTTDPQPGWDWAEQARQALTGLTGVALPDGTVMVRTEGLDGAPVGMGRDEQGRYEYSVNVDMEVVQPTAARPLG